VLHRGQAQADPWLFVAHKGDYYAHCPTFHAPEYGYCEHDAAELADALWGHYFTLRLGPLVLSAVPAASASPPADTPSIHAPAQPDIQASYAREQQALDHFQRALTQIRQGDYAAAKDAIQRSFACSPANGFYSHKRVETLGDIQSYLGDDQAAERHYERALALVMEYHESWANTELRLKLSWCALRRDRADQARVHIDVAIASCARGRAEDGGHRSLNYLHGLALATLADMHLHQRDLDAALEAAHAASAIASRLGQSYGEKARLYAYLAWQLYLHGETAEARTLAKQAWAALEQWLPVASAQTQAMRMTLTTILGGSLPQPRGAKITALPPFATIVASALAAARRMQHWAGQVTVLHTLAPHLERGQLRRPFTDMIVWGEEDKHFFAPYRTLLEADLALAVERPRKTQASTAYALVTLEPKPFEMHNHERLYAETLVRLHHQLELQERERLTVRIEACAAAWCARLGSVHDERTVGPITGLSVLLPYLQAHTQPRVIAQIEDYLIAQLRANHVTPALFLTALPALSRLNAGDTLFEAMLTAKLRSVHMWIACLDHAVTRGLAELRAWIVDVALDNLTRSAPYGSTTAIAEIICHLAPYLQGDEIHRALTLATPVRSIVPRVQALAAVATVIPSEEREPVLVTAWQAASRSKDADTVGEALAALVVTMYATLPK
jgi:tetratricopeptide (TPR) repeat protein